MHKMRGQEEPLPAALQREMETGTAPMKEGELFAAKRDRTRRRKNSAEAAQGRWRP